MNEIDVRAILAQYGLWTTKSLGQNFLKDASVLSSIAAAASGDYILEIGAGIGSLTNLLCQKAKKAVTIEIDRSLEPLLEREVPAENHRFLWQDVLKCDLKKIAAEEFGGKCTIVGNLPYYITTEILLLLLKEIECWDQAVLMVQREVAERLLAAKGKEYRAASVWVQGLCEGELLFEVPPHCFHPAPHVHSAVIRLTPKKDRPDPKGFIAFAQAAFAARRKMFASSSAVQGLLHTDKAGLCALLEAAELPQTARAETFSPQDFLRLFQVAQNLRDNNEKFGKNRGCKEP